MEGTFNGSELRLARMFNRLSLEDIAVQVGKTRQYIHKLETGQTTPTPELLSELANALNVSSEMFGLFKPLLLEDQFHFRGKRTAGKTIKSEVMARGEIMVRLVNMLDQFLKLPKLALPEFSETQSYSMDDIEKAAEQCRREWGLGLGPISNMSRLVENLGIVVTSFASVSKEIDALSVASKRPIIVRNEAKESICRQRFDIGHELGHLVLHGGIVTGDRFTESQANRFSGAFLLPRSMMIAHFPPLRGGRFNWTKISEFKLTWKVSKAAIIYRARQLDLISESQSTSAIITLRRLGEAITEREDYLIESENPELLRNCLKLLAERKNIYAEDISNELKITPQLLEDAIGFVPYRRPISPITLSLVT